MIHPALQEKVTCMAKNVAPIYPALNLRWSKSSGPDGIRAHLPHQVFGLR